MKHFTLLALLFFFGLSSIQAQKDLLFELTFVHAEDISAYDEYLKSNYGKIAQGRVDAGEILGWDVWKVVNNQDLDFTHMITTISDISDTTNYNLNYAELMGLSEKSAELFNANSNKIRKVKRRNLVNLVANVDKNGAKNDLEAPQFMVMNLMKVNHLKDYGLFENLEVTGTPTISDGDARVGWSLHRRLDNLGTDVYYSHITIDWYANWKDYIQSNMGEAIDSKNWPKAWFKLDEIRDLRNRVMFWKFIEIKAENE